MTFATHPPDTGFTTWVAGPGSPSKPGAGDMNRLQNNEIALFGKPSARVCRSDAQLIPSSFTFSGLVWNQTAIESDPALVDTIGGAAYTDKIHLLYTGEWEVGVSVRAQYNNTAGNAELQLVAGFTGGGSNVLIDQDIQPCNSVFPNVLKCSGMTIIVAAADVTNGIYLRAEYVQDSGGDAQITTHPFAYPAMWARWIGMGN